MGVSGGRVGISRRQVLCAAAAVVATGATMVGTSVSVSADTYGSGALGPWRELTRSISDDAQIRRVLAGDGVFMFGDSIGVQDGDALALRLTGLPLAVDNWSGRPTEAAVDALQTWATTYGLPNRILMAVGTNDIFKPPAFGPQVKRAMEIAGPGRTVYWVNTRVSRTKEPEIVQRADLRNSTWVNRQLDDAADRYPNLRVIRWSEFLGKVKYPHRYLRDGLHTSIPLGQHWRNDLITQALRTNPAS